MLKNLSTKYYLVICMIIGISQMSSAQAPDTLWTKYYQMGTFTYGYSIEETFDGGLIIVGDTGEGETLEDIYLVKTDVNGDTAWTKVIGESQAQVGRCVKQTADSGFVIAGFTGNPSATRWAYILKTDINGDTLWTTKNPDSNSEAFYIELTSDGGYIVTGIEFVPGYWADVFLMKISGNGDIDWKRTYGDIYYEEGRFVQQTNDGGYFITGYFQGNGGAQDMLLIKTDSSGFVEWSKNYSSGVYDYANSGLQTSDDGFIVCGKSAGSIGYILKTDSNGDSLWSKSYNPGGVTTELFSVQPTNDGGYIFGGYSGILGYNNQFCFIKTDVNGDTLWTKVCGGFDRELGYSVKQLSDGSYIMAGETSSFVNGSALYIVKLGSEPSAIYDKSELENPQNFNLYQNFPNPFNPVTQIKYQLPMQSDVKLSVYNTLGQQVAKLVSETQSAGYYTVEWDASGLASGAYLYRIEVNKFIQIKKMLMMK